MDKTDKIFSINILITVLLYIILLPTLVPINIMNRMTTIIWAITIVVHNLTFWGLILYVNGCFDKFLKRNE